MLYMFAAMRRKRCDCGATLPTQTALVVCIELGVDVVHWNGEVPRMFHYHVYLSESWIVMSIVGPISVRTWVQSIQFSCTMHWTPWTCGFMVKNLEYMSMPTTQSVYFSEPRGNPVIRSTEQRLNRFRA